METIHLTILGPAPHGKPGYSAAHYMRLQNATPTRWTLCGAAITDGDMTKREWPRNLKSKEFGPRMCKDCTRLLSDRAA